MAHDNNRGLLQINGKLVVLWKGEVPQETLAGAQRARQKLERKVNRHSEMEGKIKVTQLALNKIKTTLYVLVFTHVAHQMTVSMIQLYYTSIYLCSI